MCHCWANEHDFTLINTKFTCLLNRVGPQRSSLGNFSRMPSPQCSSHSLGTTYFFQSGLFCPASGLLKSDIPDNTYMHVVLVCVHCCGYVGLVSIVRMGTLYRVMTFHSVMSSLFSPWHCCSDLIVDSCIMVTLSCVKESPIDYMDRSQVFKCKF